MTHTVEHFSGSDNQLPVSPEALRGVIDALDDPYESRAIELLLAQPDSPISWGVINDQVLPHKSLEDQTVLRTVNDTLGFPTYLDRVQPDLMSPNEIKQQFADSISSGTAYFNNEFALFMTDPTWRPGDAFDDPQKIMENAYALNPARIRFRELFPRLYSELHEKVMSSRVEDRVSMRAFYESLLDNDSESQKSLTMFTIADQLLQRLIRQYEVQRTIVDEHTGSPDATTQVPAARLFLRT